MKSPLTCWKITIQSCSGPGGQFKAFLLLEKEEEQYAKDSKGNPILPVFKLGPSEVQRGRDAPVFASDTAWSIWKAEAPVKPGGSAFDIFQNH